MSIFHQRVLITCLTLAALSLPMVAMAASTITYTYDVFGQLIGVNSTAGRTVSYTYDAAANRTNMSATGSTALNASTTQTQTAAMSNEAPAAASQAFANNQSTAMRQTPRSQSGSTGNSATRALR